MLHPITDLFLRTVTVNPGERVLMLHSGDPALARWLVEQAGQVVAFHASYCALQQLACIPGLQVSDAVYPDPVQHGPADAALLKLPKGRDFCRALLWTAAQTLRPGGMLYLAGANEGGAKSSIKDAAELFGAAPVLDYKSSYRIASATRPGSLTLPAGWIAAWEPQTRPICRPEGVYTIITMPGVFSWDHLDEGTALLLDHLGVESGMTVLDIGCGYGIIGLAAARAGAWVTLVDDDLLAVRCARASVVANGLEDRCTVLPSDVISAVRGARFDLVLSNPPFHKGVDVNIGITRRMVREAFEVLCPGGRLRLVANRFLPYEPMLRTLYGNAHMIAQTNRFTVLEAVR